jgi:hypothetical protein
MALDACLHPPRTTGGLNRRGQAPTKRIRPQSDANGSRWPDRVMHGTSMRQFSKPHGGHETATGGHTRPRLCGRQHPLQQRGRDAPGGGGDWELDRAMKRRHEETLQMLLDPLDTLLPPKGVNTTLTSKAKLSARVANHPAFKLACQLTVTQARIDFYEPTAKIEYGVHGELVPFSLDKDFRAATIVCTVAVGEWSLDVTVPLELATCRNGGFCTPSLSTAVGQWMACSDVSSTLDELRAQIKAKWEDDRAAKEAMWNAKWPALAYKHPTSEPPVYLKSFEAWREDVGGGPSAGSDKRGREEPCENESPNSPARSPAKQARLM